MIPSPGTRVRFTAAGLGRVKADGSTPAGKFEPGFLARGAEGVVAETMADAPDGWFYVRPDDYPDSLVPVFDGFVEVVS